MAASSLTVMAIIVSLSLTGVALLFALIYYHYKRTMRPFRPTTNQESRNNLTLRRQMALYETANPDAEHAPISLTHPRTPTLPPPRPTPTPKTFKDPFAHISDRAPEDMSLADRLLEVQNLMLEIRRVQSSSDGNSGFGGRDEDRIEVLHRRVISLSKVPSADAGGSGVLGSDVPPPAYSDDSRSPA
ncbi:hypothetical protein GALMADRAFT_133929 [Galerina marginata CBS 339.88]|uniref:Uncharacterized protein n=1 Tax=Galerina marginata (strain CBS 339.88) TaxID=685588 RepID=A0A067TNC8_GALM3|nr:hypothetical protein GALMADRAFT_133929 [Galerina marginata CBS 339.88]